MQGTPHHALQYRLRWVSQGPIHIAEDEEMVSPDGEGRMPWLFIGFESLVRRTSVSWGSGSTGLQPMSEGFKDP